MKRLIWIGHRESEIAGIEHIFSSSITAWGSNKGTNRSLNVSLNKQEINKEKKFDFYLKELQNLSTSIDDMIMCYSPQTAYKLIHLCPMLKPNFICLNPREILSVLNNKIHMRLWLNNKISLTPYATCFGKECLLDYFQHLFPNIERFIIQKSISSGGDGTFIMSKMNEKSVLAQLNPNELYLVTPFIEMSVPVNIHISIHKDNILVFPGSMQLIENLHDQMLYRGADYVTYSRLTAIQKENLHFEAQKIGRLLHDLGYRGVCGLDFLVTENSVFFIEANPRFQASTALLNKALVENGMPSIHELELSAHGITAAKQVNLDNLSVNYSFYKYCAYEEEKTERYKQRLSVLKKSSFTKQLFCDGFIGSYKETGTYLYSACFDNNISAVTPSNTLILHQNIVEDDFMNSSLPFKQQKQSMIKLKIALLNQGMRISDSAREYLKKAGNYNESTFGSMDLLIDKVRINVPISDIIYSLSPFILDTKQETLMLRYYDEEICRVTHESQRSFSNKMTTRGVPYHKIAFISGDRLRIKTEKICHFKHIKQGCLFCPNAGYENSFSIPAIKQEDIKEVFDYCLENETFRHIMIGGGSANPENREDKVLQAVNYIRSKCNKDIYLMSIPPNNRNRIDEYIEAGVTEFAFNLELMDRNFANKIMPGKGKIPLSQYMEMLSYARSKLPNESIRSMLIIGLEPMQNSLNGVKLLCENGIQPMLSIFRPTKSCRLHHMVPMSNKEILTLYKEADAICQAYGMTLGPTCASCQNNTLALSY